MPTICSKCKLHPSAPSHRWCATCKAQAARESRARVRLKKAEEFNAGVRAAFDVVYAAEAAERYKPSGMTVLDVLRAIKLDIIGKTRRVLR